MRIMRRWALFFIGLISFMYLFFFLEPAASLVLDGQMNEVNGLPRKEISIKGQSIVVEVARGGAVNHGLMFRETLPWDKGMLFVFEPPRRTAMWMENTFIPLSVAFICEDGYISNIKEMKPLTTDLHYSKGIAAYALEMNQGWFENNGINPGDQVDLNKIKAWE